MGAFFLHKGLCDSELISATKIFESKGFTSPQIFQAGGWEILYYNKLADKTGQIFVSEDTAAFAIGTFMCDGKRGTDALKHIVEHIDTGMALSLIGHYTILVIVRGKWSILMDGLNTKHVFHNEAYTCFSSSMLAVASVEKAELCKKSILEKCLTGLIVSPDTLFQNVKELNRVVVDKVSEKAGIKIQYLPVPDMKNIKYEKEDILQSAEKRAKTLREYLEQWNKLEAESNVDLGLSGGYDSTLLFALGYVVFNKQLHIHTHSTGHVHDQEKRIAQQICESRNLDCHIVSTQHFDKMEGNPISLLRENVLFFDGRTAPEIGGFSPTYTASYRTLATEGSLFTLTGVGGEVYRNPYALPKRKIKGKVFFERRICNLFFREAVQDDEVIHEILIHHLQKAEAILGIKLTGEIPYENFRRYYSEIVMPEGQGHVIDAYNTVSQCIAPFLEPSVIYDAYKAVPCIGNTGEYEAAIIGALDRELYQMESSYGYPFCKVPASEKIKSYLRVHIPPRLWNFISIKRNRNTNQAYDYFMKVCDKCPELRNAYRELYEYMDNVHLDILMHDSRTMAAIAYIALVMTFISKGRLLI